MHFVAIGFVEHFVPLTEIKLLRETTDTRCAVIELLARGHVDGQIATDLANAAWAAKPDAAARNESFDAGCINRSKSGRS